MYRLSVSIVVLGLLVTFGCGKSNPAANYSGLKSDPVNRQNTAPAQAFQIAACTVEEDGSSNSNFIQGQPGTVSLTVYPAPGIGDCKLYPVPGTDTPGQFTQSTQDPTKWTWTWTPPKDSVSGSSALKTISVLAYPASVADINFNSGRIAPEKFQIQISKDAAAPSIGPIVGFLSKVNEGDAPFTFTVSGSDPSLPSVRPNIRALPCDLGDNAEQNVIIDGSGFVREQLSNGGNMNSTTWQFDSSAAAINYKLQDKANVNQVKICVSFAVLSSDGRTLSPARSVQTWLTLSAQSPVFKFDNEDQDDSSAIVVAPGETKTLHFLATIPNGKGTAAVNYINNGFSSQRGVSKLDCSEGPNSDATVQSCTITWNVPCNIKSSPDLMLNASNKDNGSKPGNRIIRSITVDTTKSCSSTPSTSASDSGAQSPSPQDAAVKPSKVAVKTVAQGQTPQAKRGVSSTSSNVLPAPKTAPTLYPALTADVAKKRAQFAVVAPLDSKTDSADKDKGLTQEQQKANRTKAHKKPPMGHHINSSSGTATNTSTNIADSTTAPVGGTK